MPTFARCTPDVADLAAEVIRVIPQHKPIADFKVRIDFVFAHAFCDPVSGEPVETALKQHGVPALAVTRKIGLKDRAMGRGDVEIAISGDWWEEHDEPEQKALLDHELTHIVPTGEADALDRPKITLRPHDYQFGWFKCIAERHGIRSVECQQARTLMEVSGQLFWPGIVEQAQQRKSRVAALEV